MTELEPLRPEPLVRMADGTIKQRNVLTGTEVWTVPGRSKRPLRVTTNQPRPLEPGDREKFCAFCSQRYLETPPEKSRLYRQDGTWHQLNGVDAEHLFEHTADFRRIPNLFEIVSYNYWHLNHNHHPSEGAGRRMAEYLASPTGYDHVLRMAKLRAQVTKTNVELDQIPDDQLFSVANGFFAGGHDVVVARRHFTDTATTTAHLASSGTLSAEEHQAYIRFTVDAMRDLYRLNEAVKYVAAFQNWLSPAGASFDHLHKQLVALDEVPVQIEAESDQVRRNPYIYEQIITYVTHKNLLVAGNDYALAFADFGHRYPTYAVWPLGAPRQPWEYSPEELDGISDLVHAVHVALGPEVACNEEWYHRPLGHHQDLRFRILIKQRGGTLAGFEGGTRIYLNTIDPWTMRDSMVEHLTQVRAQGLVADSIVLAGDLRLRPSTALT